MRQLEQEDREQARYLVLSAMYELSGGGELRYVQDEQIAHEKRIALETVRSALRYLSGEGLVVNHATGGLYGITHRGIVEVERSLKKPNEATEHFTATVIQNFHRAVGVVQTGDHNIANVIQQVGPNDAALARILNAIEAASRKAPEEKRAEIEAHLGDIREEMAAPEAGRKVSRLKAHAWALWALTRDTAVVAAAVAELLKFFGISP